MNVNGLFYVKKKHANHKLFLVQTKYHDTLVHRRNHDLDCERVKNKKDHKQYLKYIITMHLLFFVLLLCVRKSGTLFCCNHGYSL